MCRLSCSNVDFWTYSWKYSERYPPFCTVIDNDTVELRRESKEEKRKRKSEVSAHTVTHTHTGVKAFLLKRLCPLDICTPHFSV